MKYAIEAAVSCRMIENDASDHFTTISKPPVKQEAFSPVIVVDNACFDTGELLHFVACTLNPQHAAEV